MRLLTIVEKSYEISREHNQDMGLFTKSPHPWQIANFTGTPIRKETGVVD